MNIALIAHDSKKELMVQFCIAYSGVLARHNLCATGVTGKMISDATGLPVVRFLSGSQGGSQQIAARISCNEIDVVLYFRDPLDVSAVSYTHLELLAVLAPHFEVIPSSVDETVEGDPSPEERVMQLAQRKAQDVFSTHPQDVVVGADTLVFLDGRPLGKPKDREDAAQMLRSLSGRVHEVITGVCVLWPRCV